MGEARVLAHKELKCIPSLFVAAGGGDGCLERDLPLSLELQVFRVGGVAWKCSRSFHNCVG